jgi:hypothetical protein
MLGRVAFVRTDVSEEISASIVRVTIGKLGTTLAVASNRSMQRRNTKYFVFRRSVRRSLVTANVPSSPILVILMTEAICSPETFVLTGATRRNITEDGILHSHCRRNFRSYMALIGWAL